MRSSGARSDDGGALPPRPGDSRRGTGQWGAPAFALNGNRAIPDGRAYWIDPMDDYPPRARRAGETGAVTARLFVNGRGRARGCLILESARTPALEATTCRTLLRRARFQPFAANGLATFDYRIAWDLSRLPPLPPLEIRRVSRHIE